MQLSLWKKPKNARLIIGYPGFGLIGTITTGFLIDHLKCERIGTGYFTEIPATVALHSGKVMHPIDFHYNKDYNIIIMHTIIPLNTLEWKTSDTLADVCKDLAVKELITIEGVAGQAESQGRSYFYISPDQKDAAKLGKTLEKAGALFMKEGIIMGLSSALIVKDLPQLLCLFAETSANLPDSKAAAKMIEILDKYLGLEIDYKPLLQQAQLFEDKIKTILEQRKQVAEQKDKHEMNYIS